MAHLKYRPEVDGLRALAVIPVVLFHISPDWLSGGYLGVDVFFVISGFLITSLIIKDFDTGRFSMRNFWMRRVRRIVPALVVLLLTLLVAAPFLLYGPDVYELGGQALSTLFAYSNIYFWQQSGNYWGTNAEMSPLLNMWSLAVEEQFYLFYPLLLVFTLKHLHRFVTPLIALATIISLCVFIYGSIHHPNPTFYFLPTRAWELGAGCLLAVLMQRRDGFSGVNLSVQNLLSVLGLIMVVASYFLVGLGSEESVGLVAVLAVAGAVFTIGFSAQSGNVAARLLSLAPVVYIGKISYSLYLWHWPVLVYMRGMYASELGEHEGLLNLIAVGVFMTASVLSYHFVEQPFRRNKAIVWRLIPAYLIALSVSIAWIKIPFYEDVSDYKPTLWWGYNYQWGPQRVSELDERVKRSIKVLTLPKIDENEHSRDETGMGNFNADDPDVEVYVMGDSHGVMHAKVLDESLSELGSTYKIAVSTGADPIFSIPVTLDKGGSMFTPSQLFEFNSKKLAYIEEYKPDVVIVVMRWDFRMNREYIFKNLDDLTALLASQDSKLLLIGQPPVLAFGQRSAPQYSAYIDAHSDVGSTAQFPITKIEEYNAADDFLKDYSARHDNCEYLSVEEIFRNGGEAILVQNGEVLYVDDDHLSYAGSLLAKPHIKAKIAEMLSTPLPQPTEDENTGS